MQFGLGPFSMQSPPGAGKIYAGLYREMLNQVEIAEEIAQVLAGMGERKAVAVASLCGTEDDP